MGEKLRHTATAFQRDMDDVPAIASTQDGILGTLRRREVLFWRRWSLCRGRCWSCERGDVSHMEIIEQYAATVSRAHGVAAVGKDPACFSRRN